MRLRTAGLLSMALCLYFVGGAALDGLGAVIPFICMIDMVLVGLFLPLLPRWEGAALYLFAAGVDIVELVADIPYMLAKYTAFVEVAKAAASGQLPRHIVDFFSLPQILMQAFIILFAGFVLVTAISLLKSFLTMGKTLMALSLVSSSPMLLGMYWISRPILFSGQTLLSLQSHAVAAMMTNLIVFMSVYAVLASPFLAIVFFRWLGVYRRIPSAWGNS